jgi:hypothetical protein
MKPTHQKSRIRHEIWPLVFFLWVASIARASVFQYSLPVEILTKPMTAATQPDADATTLPASAAKKLSTGSLWIPPRAEQVRGVVLAGMTLTGGEFVQDAHNRKVCEDDGLAIDFLQCGLGADPPLEVRATSDSGLTVEFHIASGLAAIEGGKLVLKDIPARDVAHPYQDRRLSVWQKHRDACADGRARRTDKSEHQAIEELPRCVMQ